ncbi:MAG: hypothetical protein JKY25_10540 [Robiginitomaculum sp.]|nr:hypothetical protein [Robiginitomaculum sp.]
MANLGNTKSVSSTGIISKPSFDWNKAGAISGGVFDALGQVLSGRAESAAADTTQANLNYQAGQEVAQGQHSAQEERRQAKILASRALAVAAAGGGAADPSTARAIADIDGEGAYRAAIQLYRGRALSDKLIARGNVVEIEADASRDANNIGAARTIGGLFGKYG